MRGREEPGAGYLAGRTRQAPHEDSEGRHESQTARRGRVAGTRGPNYKGQRPEQRTKAA